MPTAASRDFVFFQLAQPASKSASYQPRQPNNKEARGVPSIRQRQWLTGYALAGAYHVFKLA